MHIKQITLSNFRSFRQQAEMEEAPLSAGLNAVVGRNGSGKSNLFDAVQFALLAPRFANLRQEERQALLHEGSGSAAVHAFVEIVFDNADHRLQLSEAGGGGGGTHSDEVVLRRTIGLKKDEFFLQRQRVNKTEIQSLLEGAGFSKSNPYYLVQQGKIQDLCLMSDAQRLRLLKEVAGTVVYDERKTESLAKMEENASTIAKIQEILQDIQQRLEELQSEKDELTAYQRCDRQRRAVEYTLYDQEWRKARTILDSLEQEWADHGETVRRGHDRAKETHEAIRQVEASLSTQTHALQRQRKQIQLLEEDKKQAWQAQTQLELQCREIQEAIQQAEEVQAGNRVQLQQVQQEIDQAVRELQEQVQPAHEQAVAALQQAVHRQEQVQGVMEGLYAKQGRFQRFRSVQERDAHLQSHLAELQTAQLEQQDQLQGQREALAQARRTLDKETKQVQNLSTQLSEQQAAGQAMSKSLEEKKRQRIELQDERKEHWRRADELREQMRESRENMHRALSDMRKSMPRATAMGLEALRSIVEQEGLVLGQQYFGMVMDNFTLRDPKYQTAVEVAAQNSLFHVVVDNDATAARLMTRLERDRLGRVTFLPLDQLRLERATYPDSHDVRPLLDTCITYDRRVDRAMQHVFSRKLLARSPELASEWSTKVSMDAITLDGDLCSRKGALTGGYVDLNKSRLRAHGAHQQAQSALQTIEREYQQVNRKAQQIDQKASTLMQEVQRLEAQQAQMGHAIATKETDIDRLQQRVENQKKQIEKLEKTTIPSLERSVATLEGEIDRLKSELGTELSETLSVEDRELLQQLKQEQTELAAQMETLSEAVAKTGVERQKLQSKLDDNLLKRQRELTEGNLNNNEESPSSRRASHGRMSFANLQAQRQDELAERQEELAIATRVKEEIDGKIEKCRKAEEEIRGQLMTAKNTLEQLKSQDAKNMKVLEEAQDKSERLLTKRSMCMSNHETYIRKIQELGSLPPPAELEKFANKSIAELMKALEGVNKELKKYSHVNKKAYDQYMSFSEQRESLLKRKEELDVGAQKVKELIESLERQKDEAINRTFRGVSAHFKDVFKELVPNGAGELIIRTAMDDEDDDNDDEETESSQSEPSGKKAFDPKNPDVNLYRGVGIKVRFSEVGENFMMSQLSGGQKALVALALIFAIQRCDPAPFYLFDELDQALDSSYRAAVANLIQRQANSKDNPTQFIVSTFRPELVSVANRCYGISHQNKVSSVHPLSKKDALHFIANLMNEEEAVGEVTTVATSKGGSTFLTQPRKRKTAEQEAEGNEATAEGEDEGATAPTAGEGTVTEAEGDDGN